MSLNPLQTKRHYVLDKIIVGIDPAQKKHQAAVIDLRGIQVGKSFTFPTTRAGFDNDLWEKLHKILPDFNANNLVFAIETSCHLWQTFVAYVQRKHYQVLLVSPLTTKHTRPAMNHDFSKTDPKDALLVANNARDGYFDFYRDYSDHIVAMHRLAITYHKERHDYVCNLQRLKATVERVFPEFSSVMGVDSATGQYLLAKYLLPQEIQSPQLLLEAEQIAKISSRHFGLDTLIKLQTLAQHSIGVPTYHENITAERLSLHSWLPMMQFLDNQMSETIDQLLVFAKQTPYYSILSSLKGYGISDTLIALFIAETRNLADFSHYKKVEKFAGFNLRLCDSGKYIGQRKINRIGNKRLSWILYWMTKGAAKHIPEVELKYLRRQLHHRSHRKNIVACIPVLLKIIMAMIREHRPYELREEKVKQVEALRQSLTLKKEQKKKKGHKAA
jgi:transposase